MNLRHWYHLHRWPSAAMHLRLTPREHLYVLRGYLYDRLSGIQTMGNVTQDELGLDKNTSCWYQPCGWGDLRKTLRPDIVTEEDVFIDFGSGKGRMLYLAAHSYPFKKVIGIEVSEELNKIARRNMQKNLHRLKCKNVDIVTSNVSDYDITDDITVVYFYNPFWGAVFSDLIAKLRVSLLHRPRRMRVIYRNPVMHDCLIDNGFSVTQKSGELVVYE